MFLKSIFISYMSGLLVMLSMRNHLLLSLIGIEFLMITVYLIMFYSFILSGLEVYFMILFLVLLVCEGSLGLSILVGLIRSHGNDMINSLYMVMW